MGLASAHLLWVMPSHLPRRSKISFASSVLFPSAPSFRPLYPGMALRFTARRWAGGPRISHLMVFHVDNRGVLLPIPLGWVPLRVPYYRALWERSWCITYSGFYLQRGCPCCFFGIFDPTPLPLPAAMCGKGGLARGCVNRFPCHSLAPC